MDLIYVADIGNEVDELPLKWSTCLRTRMLRMEKVGAT
jgi:hypothetical protein